MQHTAFSHIGQRDSQEDRFSITELSKTHTLFTVCDGHGGDACVEFVIDNFPNVFKRHYAESKAKSPNIDKIFAKSVQEIIDTWDTKCLGKEHGIVDEATKRAFFEKLDIETYSRKGYESGCTLTAVFLNLDKRKFHVCNLGDSRAAWQLNNVITASKDHKVPATWEVPGFKTWIEDERLQGDLAMSCSIGDLTADLTGVVGRKPDISSVSFGKNECTIIVGSDGLFDEVSSQEALFREITEAKELLKPDPHEDNVTVIHITIPSLSANKETSIKRKSVKRKTAKTSVDASERRMRKTKAPIKKTPAKKKSTKKRI